MLPAPQDCQELPVPWVRLGYRVLRARSVPPGFKGLQAQKGRPALRVLLELLEPQALQARTVPQELVELPVPLALREHRAQPEHRGQQVRPERRVHQVLPDLRA